MKTYMFPGQGSQSRGMGGALFDEFPDLTQRADAILGYSIKELCIDDPRGELNQTQFTQPALFTVNAFSYLKKLREAPEKPDFLAGHSLGEFNALLAAECFDFESGLQIVQKRGQLMSQAANGAMAAILNSSKEEIESILKDGGLTNIDLANFNSPSQIVISGLAEEIAQAQQLFQKGKSRFFPLNTSGAFHSRFMRQAGDDFRAFLSMFRVSDPVIPVVSNVTAKPYRSNEILDNLSRQIFSPVRWSESVQYLIGLTSGENGSSIMQFVELGAGDVLTKLVHAIKQASSSAAKKDSSAKDEKRKAGKRANDEAPAAIAAQAAPSDGHDNGSAEKTPPDVRVLEWNKRHPVGTKVKSLTGNYTDLETRTEAVVLFGHRAAIYMKGYNGYFDLEELEPV